MATLFFPEHSLTYRCETAIIILFAFTSERMSIVDGRVAIKTIYIELTLRVFYFTIIQQVMGPVNRKVFSK